MQIMNFDATIVAKFDYFNDVCMPLMLHYFIYVVPYFYLSLDTLVGAAVLAYPTVLERSRVLFSFPTHE